MFRAHTIKIAATPEGAVVEREIARYWTGLGTLSLRGREWSGMGEAASVSGLQLTAGRPDLRSLIKLSGIPVDMRTEFLQDAGPLNVTVRWIYSSDLVTWTEAPVVYKGRISDAHHRDGVIEIELETRRGDVERGRPFLWSHEEQMRRHSGDRGLEHMANLSQVGYDTGWPP